MAAIACDLDRTLIGQDGVLGERTRIAIAAARAAGIAVFIVTGRMFASARPYALEAGLDGPVVCYQGALVADARSGETLHHAPIPVGLAREAIESIIAEGYSPNVYIDDVMYVSEHTDYTRRYSTFQHIPVEAVGDLVAFLEQAPTKLVLVADPEELGPVEVKLRAHFADRMFVARSLPHFLEFAAHGVTKGSGLTFVTDHVGVALAETVAFGDGENDVELLETAAFGIAVGDAHPRLGPVSDWTCAGPEVEGVATVIEALLAAGAGPGQAIPSN